MINNVAMWYFYIPKGARYFSDIIVVSLMYIANKVIQISRLFLILQGTFPIIMYPFLRPNVFLEHNQYAAKNCKFNVPMKQKLFSSMYVKELVK